MLFSSPVSRRMSVRKPLMATPTFQTDEMVPSFKIDFSKASLPSALAVSRASTGTFVQAAGGVGSAGTNTPRYDTAWNGTAFEGRGIAIEASASTNIVTNSDAISGWSSNVSPTKEANVEVAPDGTTTADRITTSANSVSGVYSSVAVSDATTYTFSIFGKYISGATTPWRIGFSSAEFGTGVQTAQFFVNPSTGAITSPDSGVVRTRSRYIGDGWWRFEVTATTATAAGSTELVLYSGSAEIKTAAWWGAQVEARGFASSYIPTAGASATRAAESANFTDLSMFGLTATQPEFTYYCEFTLDRNGSSASFDRPVGLGTSTNGALFYVHITGSIYSYFRVAGATIWEAGVGPSGIPGGGRARVAVRAKAGEHAIAATYNGGAVSFGTSSSASMPTIDRVALGANSFNGAIKVMEIYPVGLSDDMLRKLVSR